MYIEFGCGETLEKSPMIYGMIHQVVCDNYYINPKHLFQLILHLQVSIYFAAYFICALGGEYWTSHRPFLLGSVGFSGFFTYEICRKLDPTLPLVSWLAPT